MENVEVRTETSWSGLEDDLQAIERELSAAMGKAMPWVANAMKDVLKAHIQEDVYDAYAPTMYERRWTEGGIIDLDSNALASADGDSAGIFYQPDGTDEQWEQPLNGDLLVRRIESGSGYEWKSPGPHPFFQNFVRDMVEGGDAETLAVAAMNAADPSLEITADGNIILDPGDWMG